MLHTPGKSRVTTKPGLWTGLDYGLDSIMDSQDAETVFYSVLQCSKRYQVYVAILIHKMTRSVMVLLACGS